MNTGIAHIDLASYISLVNPPFELSKIEICLRRAFNSVKIEFIENMSLHGELLIKYNISVANPLHTTPINLGLVYSQPTSGVLFLSKANFYMSLTLGPDHVIGSMLIRHFKEQTGSYQNISPGRFQNTSSSSFISF